MRTVQQASQQVSVSGVILVIALLGAVEATVGLGALGWAVGLGTATSAAVLLARARQRTATTRFGPANVVTLVRASIGQVVAALVAASFSGTDHRTVLVALATVALLLDAVDGQVARRTGSVTRVRRPVRHGDRRLPHPRPQRRGGSGGRLVGPRDRGRAVCAARCRTALAVAAGAGSAPLLAQGRRGRPGRHPRGGRVRAARARRSPSPLVVMALLLLAESFGRDVLWLARRRQQRRAGARARGPAAGRPGPPVADTGTLSREVSPPEESQTGPPRSHRRARGVLLTALSVALLWAALDLPNRPELLSWTAFLRLPVELLVLVALGTVLPSRWRTVVSSVAGVVIALAVLLKALDVGMLVGFYRTFDPLSDPSYAAAGYGVLRDSVGSTRAVLVTVALGLAVAVALVLLPLAAVRVTRSSVRHRRFAASVLVVGGLLWVLLAVLGTDRRARLARGVRSHGVGRGRPCAGSAAGHRGPVGVRAARHDRPLRHDAAQRSARRPAGQGRPRGLRRELRPGRPRGSGAGADGLSRRRPDDRRNQCGGLLGPQRLPQLADLRRAELAGPLHPPDRAADLRPGPLQRGPGQPAAHVGLGVRVGRLAHRPRQPGRRERHLARHRVLRLRRALRRSGARLPRPEVRVCAGAGPVHPGHPGAARAGPWPPAARDGGGRPRLQPHARGLRCRGCWTRRRSATGPHTRRCSTRPPPRTPSGAARRG